MLPVRESRAVSVLLSLLIATDLAFCALHLLHTFSPVANDWIFSIERDRSYAELFQYIKLFWIILLLAGLTWFGRSFAYLGWAALFAYMLLDDVFSLHEHAGGPVAAALGLPALLKLRPDDLGELITVGTVGVVLLLLLGLSYLQSNRHQRRFGVRMGLLLGVLVFFAVCVDVLHMFVIDTPGWAAMLALLEDGGEMLTVSVIVSAVLEHWLAVPALQAAAREPGAVTVNATGPAADVASDLRPDLRIAASGRR